MKMKNYKVFVVLFLMTIVFSFQTLAQVPSGYTIVKTHNDDITWYEVRDNSGNLGAIYNNKLIDHCSDNWTSVSYSHGYFFYQYKGEDSYFVYDKYGNEFKSTISYHNIINGYEVIDGKLFMFGLGGICNEKREKIGVRTKEVDNNRYLITCESDKCGITDLVEGKEILAPEFDDCDCITNDLFKFKMNGYWGIMNRQGKIIIPISRHYTSIDYSRTLKMYTFTKETETQYFKGECNANGVQTSIEKTGTKSKPQQQAKQEPKPQPQPKQEPKEEPKPTPPTPPTPPRPLQPFQVWQECFMCGGSGQCRYCYGYGWAANGKDACGVCHGTGKCSQCAGHGGKNVIEYH